MPEEERTARASGRAEAGGEWYRDGLRFECTQCGNCCTGPPGAVWFTPEEGRKLAALLKVSEGEFLKRYARKPTWGNGGWSLNEHKTEHGLDCVFLDRTTQPGKALCGVYEARPSQCRTWPFWPENLKTEAAWREVKKRTPCPGMDKGTLVPVEKIRIQRDG